MPANDLPAELETQCSLMERLGAMNVDLLRQNTAQHSAQIALVNAAAAQRTLQAVVTQAPANPT
jgi:hypothetical protein